MTPSLGAVILVVRSLILPVEVETISDPSSLTDSSPGLFRSLLDRIRECALVLEPDDARIVDCNRAASERLGYDRDEFLERSLVDVEATIEDCEDLIESARALAPGESLSFEGELHRKGDENLPVDVELEWLEVGKGFLLLLAEARTSSSRGVVPTTRPPNYYRDLFEKAPIGLVEVDASELFGTLRELRSSEPTAEHRRTFDPDRLDRIVRDLEIREVNDRLLELVEAEDVRELRGNLDRLPHSDAYDSLGNLLRKFADRQRHIETEVKMRTLGGAIRWVRLIVESVGPPESFHSEVFVSVLDVTHRRRNEKKLRTREKSFRNLVSNVPGIVYRCEPDADWTMRFISDDVEEITGYPAEDFLGDGGRGYASVIVEEDREHVTEVINDALEERDTFEVEYRLRHRNGDVRWVFERGRALRDEDGQPRYLEGVIQDVTDRHEMQQRLRESEQRYRKLFENARVGMAELSFDEEWLSVNDELLKILGYEEEELLGSRCREITHPEDVEEDERCAQKLIEAEAEYFTSEKRYRHRDGHWVWVRVTVSRIDTPRAGHEGYFVAIVEDVHQRRETERKLRRSERQFRTLFEQATVGIAHVALDGTLNRMNDKFADLMGYHRDELVGTTFQEITHEEDLEEDLEKLEQLKDGEIDQYEIEKRYVRQDGSSFWAQLSVGAVVDDEGHLDYFVSVIKDITDRKRAEKELRRSESKYRTTFEDAGIGMAHIGRQGRIIRSNERLADFLGYSREELVNASFEDLIHPEDLPELQRKIDRLWSGETDHFSLEQRYLRKDGRVVWGDVNVGIPRGGGSESPSHMIGSIQDITRRKIIHERQETFFRLSPDLMAIADFDGKFVEVNPAFESTLGYSAEELTSRPFLEFVHPDDEEATREEIERLRGGDTVVNFENRYVTRDGDTRWFNWKATPGEDVVYAVARDVTERREFEQRLRTMVREKETLLKEVHHRVKNNLQVISSLLDMQRRRLDDRETTEALENSTRRVKSMALIHEQLYQSDQLTSIDLENYINDLIDHLLRVQRVGEGDVTVNLTVEEKHLRLDQAIPCGLVLNELLSNSLEHGQSPEGTTVVEVKLRSPDEGELRLTVQDNGPGFPEEANVLEAETLGMEVVRSLVEYELDGDVRIENRGGARVTVTFPLDDSNQVTEN